MYQHIYSVKQAYAEGGTILSSQPIEMPIDMHIEVRVISAMRGAHAQQLADKDTDAGYCSE